MSILNRDGSELKEGDTVTDNTGRKAKVRTPHHTDGKVYVTWNDGPTGGYFPSVFGLTFSDSVVLTDKETGGNPFRKPMKTTLINPTTLKDGKNLHLKLSNSEVRMLAQALILYRQTAEISGQVTLESYDLSDRVNAVGTYQGAFL